MLRKIRLLDKDSDKIDASEYNWEKHQTNIKVTENLKKNYQSALFQTIDGIIVDCRALTSIKHSCLSSNCKISQCCCSHFEVFTNLPIDLADPIIYHVPHGESRG